MMQVGQGLIDLFTRERMRAIEAGDIRPDSPTELGLLAVLESMRAYMENIELTRADEKFLRRMMKDHATPDTWPEVLFRCCTAIVISKLSGERMDGDG